MVFQPQTLNQNFVRVNLLLGLGFPQSSRVDSCSSVVPHARGIFWGDAYRNIEFGDLRWDPPISGKCYMLMNKDVSAITARFFQAV